MASTSIETAAVAKKSKGRSKPDRFDPNYWPFVIPALIVIAAVIVFPWVC
ncbi:sugar ABC transporter permease, partial [Rhizobium ruizarguesonis]